VAHSTISTGSMHGGGAVNIVPKNCSVTFEFRYLPEVDPESILTRISAFIANELLPTMRSREPEAVIAFEPIYDYPAFNIDPSHPFVTRIKGIVGHNRHSKVAFGTEAGLFQRDLGVPTVVCGPGSIDVAHKPDEFVSQDQLDRCDLALRGLLL
jgi:acetylornithine deacetylase